MPNPSGIPVTLSGAASGSTTTKTSAEKWGHILQCSR
jgi:hypothetical protein